MAIDFNNEIESLLYDQDKIVTYKLLNNQFNITPNEAKSIIKDFVEKFRGEKTFFVTYLIIGEDLKTKKKRVFLTNEQDLDSIKNEYKVISKQIYSVHKNFIQDFELFYGADLENSSNNQRKSNLKVESTGVYRTGEASFVEKPKVSNEQPKPISSVSNKQELGQIDKSKNDEPKKEAIKVPGEKKSTGIASMFANQKPVTKKQEEAIVIPKEEKPAKKKIDKEEEKMELDEPNNQIKKETEKVEEKPKAKKDLVKKAVKEAKGSRKKAKKTIDSDDEENDNIKIKNEKNEPESKGDLFDDESAVPMEVEASSNLKNSSESDEYDDEIKKNNKRKRKNKQSKALNSDDDEEDSDKKSTRKPRSKKPNNNKEIDTMFNKENKTELSIGSTGTHQKKQWVTKTYVDKDGYTVTERVMETVECKAEEVIQEQKEEIKETKPIKKQNEPQTKPKASNQATLMSFFKKN